MGRKLVVPVSGLLNFSCKVSLPTHHQKRPAWSRRESPERRKPKLGAKDAECGLGCDIPDGSTGLSIFCFWHSALFRQAPRGRELLKRDILAGSAICLKWQLIQSVLGICAVSKKRAALWRKKRRASRTTCCLRVPPSFFGGTSIGRFEAAQIKLLFHIQPPSYSEPVRVSLN